MKLCMNLFSQEKVNMEAIYSMDAKVKGKGVFNYRWRIFRGIEDDLYAATTIEYPEEL